MGRQLDQLEALSAAVDDLTAAMAALTARFDAIDSATARPKPPRRTPPQKAP